MVAIVVVFTVDTVVESCIGSLDAPESRCVSTVSELSQELLYIVGHTFMMGQIAAWTYY